VDSASTRHGRGLPLVGRAEALAAVLEAAAGARDDGPRVLGVFGEPGSGKSRLIEELGDGLAVAMCSAAGEPPFGAFATIWRQLDRGDPLVVRRRSDLRAALSRLASPDELDDGEPSATGAKRRIFDAAAEAIALYAARAPVTLVVEDAQWSDLVSLELLSHLALVSHHVRAFVVVTARDEELGEQRRRIVSRLMRMPDATQVDLTALGAADSEAIIDHEVRRSGRGLGREQRRAIVRAAAGNPLYLRELARHGGEFADGDGAVPASIEASIRARLRALAPSVQGVLRAVSALGEFDEDLVAKIAAIAPDEVAAALRNGIDAGFLARPKQPWDDLRFSHELVRRAIHDDVLPAERRRLHGAMLRHLDDAPQLDPAFTRRAQHAWNAGERAQAAALNERAGDLAFAAQAFGDAADFYGRAGEASPAPGAALLDKEAMALERAGRPAAALPLLRRCLVAAAPSETLVRARILARIARAEFRAARREAASEAIENARALLAGIEPSPEHFAVNVFRAWLAATAKETDAAFAALAEAEPFRALAENEWSMRGYEAAAVAYESLRDLAGWRTSYEAMVACAEASGDAVRHVGALGNYANSAFYLGQTALALDLVARAVEIATRDRSLELVPHLLAVGAYVYLGVGDLARARALVELALPASSEFPTAELIARAVGVVAGVRTADPVFAERCLREDVLERALRDGTPWQLMVAVPALTEFYGERGRLERARAVVREAVRGLSSGRDVGANVLLAVAEHGLDREFPQVLGWLESETAKSPHTAGYLHLYRALTARGANDRQRHARTAAAAFREAGYRGLEARSHELAGDAAAARELFVACGDVRAVRRLDGGAQPQQPAVRSGLTRREAQVADLAASGLSNREIGAKLSLSDRTVEHHLGAVFSKLGIQSRVELAARARDVPSTR
jgi:DNA-binding NarL/FixJ family response regulator